MKNLELYLKVESMETANGIVTLLLRREDIIQTKKNVIEQNSMMEMAGMGNMMSQIIQQAQEQMTPQMKTFKPNIWKITLLEEEYQKLLPILTSTIRINICIEQEE